MIKVLIADDHMIVREGVKQLLNLTLDIVVIGEAHNGTQVLQQLQEKQVDVVLLDINMPAPSGLELIRLIKELQPQLPMLIFSMHNESHIVVNALKTGAKGYCSKNGDPKLLLDAIRKVYGGQRYIDVQIAESMALASAFPEQAAPHTQLSKREREVLMLLAQGMSVNEISTQLEISNKTVSTHKTHLMDKMGFDNVADLFRYVSEHGIV